MKQKLLFLFVFSCFTFLPMFTGTSYAQYWYWANVAKNAEGSPYENGDHCIVTDKAGNSYFAGDYENGSITFGKFTLPANRGGGNLFLVKYNASGNVIWAKAPVSKSIDGVSVGTAVALDSHDNIYVTGFFGDTISFSSYTLTTPNNNSLNAFIAKYDSSGNVLWAEQSAVINQQNIGADGYSVVIDADANAYITGSFYGTVSFGSFTLKSIGEADIFLVKYDSNGNVVWAKQSNNIKPKSYIYANSLAIDNSANIYQTGYFIDTIAIGIDTLRASPIREDVFLAKYDSSGNIIWTTQSNNSINSNGYGNSVAVDGDGNTYVAGSFMDSLSFGSIHLYNNNYEVFLAKFNSSGNILWTEQGISIYDDSWYGYSVACDTLKRGGGYLIMSAGTYNNNNGNEFRFGKYTFVLNDNNPDGIGTILCQFDSSGNVSCGTIFTEGTEDDGDAVAVDHSGKYVYIGADEVNQNGIFKDTIIFGKDTIPLSTNGDVPFAARWAECFEVNFKASATGTRVCNNNCDGRATVLPDSGTSPYTYLWSNGETTQTNTGLCPGTYSVAVTDNGGYKVLQSITIISNAAFYLSVSPLYDTICAGDSIQLLAVGNNPISYSWSPAIGISCSHCPNPYVYPISTTTYSLTATDTAGCDTVSEITITVLNSKATIAALPDTICAGDSTKLTASGGASYLWSTSQTTNTIWVKPSGNATFTVTAKSGTCTSSLSTMVYVNPVPVPVISGPVAICKDSSASLTVTGGTTYKWSNGETSATIETSNITSNITFTVTAYNGVCSKDTSFTLTLKSPPLVNITKDTTICDGQSITLKASGGGTYLWSTSATTDTIVVNPSSSTTYSVTVDSVCSSTSSVSVSIKTSATLITSHDTTIFTGDTAILFAAGQKGKFKYRWLPDSYLSCDTCPGINAFPPQSTTYTVTGIDSSGCSGDETITIFVEPHCYDYQVPNVFTPNGDGINDLLVI